MNTFINLAPGLVGVYLILLGMAMRTEDFKSTLCFKFLPFMLGLGSLFSSLKLFGVI